jgi:hypothetical protein
MRGHWLARFMAKVVKGDECWEWKASLDSSGYGWFFVRGKMMRAHRIAWTIANGEIPDGLQVLHHCDNRRCVNPAHLFLGNNDDNIRDRMSKGRLSGAKGERNGRAKLTEADVATIRLWLAMGHSQTAIASAYGVRQQTISWLASGKHWNAVQSNLSRHSL